MLIYKAESNLCGRPYDAPLEWPYRKPLHTNASCSLVLRIARAKHPTGPYKYDPSARGAFFPDAISRPCVEGPTALRLSNGSWLLLFDSYRTDCLLIAPPEAQPDTAGGGAECGVVAGRRAEEAGMALQPNWRSRDGRRACAYEPARRGFGAMRSDDNLRTWTDISGRVSAPADHKHGSALRLPMEAWRSVCGEAGTTRSPFLRICREREHRTGEVLVAA